MRGFLKFAVVLRLAGITVSGQERQVETILFVCERGSAKSVIAAALQSIGGTKRVWHTAQSLAERDPQVPQQIRLNLAGDGADVSK